MPKQKKKTPGETPGDKNNKSFKDKNDAILLKNMPVFFTENGQTKTGRISGFFRSITDGVESKYVIIGTSKILAENVEKARK